MKTASLFSARLACVFLLLLTSAVQAQQEEIGPRHYRFTILAGERGAKGHVDGRGADARFDSPGGLAVDAAGNVYVTEAGQCTIRKITPAGVVTTLAGVPGERGSRDGLGADARFNQPRGVAVDGAGNIYVADAGNHTVRKIDASGKVTTFAGTAGQAGDIDGPREVARLNTPIYVAVDGAENVFVGKPGSWEDGFRKIALDGSISTVKITPPLAANAYEGAWAFDMRADRAGNLYVIYSDGWDFVDLVKLTPDGEGHYVGEVIDPPTSWKPTPDGLAFDDAGNLYVKYDGNQICRFGAGGAFETRLVNGDARGYSWGGMAVDRFGTLFVPSGKLYQEYLPTIDLGGAIEMGVFYAEPPALRVQPRSQAIEMGRTVAFNIAATGAPAPTYQWTKDGIAITGATDMSLILSRVSAASAGNYRCTATNSSGSVTSEPAILSFVNTISNSRISGFSVRANLVAGRPLLAGVGVSGGSKPVLLRAVGPGLRPFMSPGATLVADPRLELYNSAATLVGSNDNWGGDSALAAAFAGAGTFPVPSDERDAALLRSLNGAHTAHILGDSGGIALFEAYDAGGPSGSRLINLSARSQVTSGDGALIAGLVITGTTSQTVLVRGVGESLARFGVRDVLPKLKLEVFDAANARLAENENWSPGLASYPGAVPAYFVLPTGSGKVLAEIATQVGAFELWLPSGDAAVLLTLSPGAYTAVLSAVGGAVGEALIEIYEVR